MTVTDERSGGGGGSGTAVPVQVVDRVDVSRHDEPGVEVAVFGSPGETAYLARRTASDTTSVNGIRDASRRRTPAQHTFAHRARDLEALWTA